MKAYSTTQVNYMKSRAEIEKLLAKNGIINKRWTEFESERGIEVALEFVFPLEHEGRDIRIGIRITIPLQRTDNEKKDQQRKNQIHRALYWYLKSKFEAVNEFDFIESFVQEFMPHILLPGQAKTVYDIFKETEGKQLLSGEKNINVELLPEG